MDLHACILFFLWSEITFTSKQEQGDTSMAGTPVPEKEGWCPPGWDRDVPTSRIYCLSDASCPGSEKCCTVGTMRICVQPAMVGLGYCPNLCPSVEEPCLVSCLDDSWCGPGEKCCQLDCHVRCVAAEPVRPGICPRKRILLNAPPCTSQCIDDRSCPKGQKCCFTGCRLECVHPITEVSHPCAEASPATTLKTCEDLCVNDADCPANKKCSPTDCGFQCKELPPAATAGPAAPWSRPAPLPTSVQPLLTSPPPETEHPGVCPVTSPKTLHLCRDRCRTDRDCPSKKKCCQNGCIRVCTEPLQVKPGACPLQLRGSMGPCLEPNRQNCSKDDDCAGAQKCCPIGCTSVCKEPEEVRPGSCPLVAAESGKEPECPTLTFCIRDKDCPQRHTKCCWHTCGWVCLAAAGSLTTLPPQMMKKEAAKLKAEETVKA